MKTISQEKMRTTIVLSAVATFESVFRIPIFDRMAVSPAKTAEPKAKTIHISPLHFLCDTVVDISRYTPFIVLRISAGNVPVRTGLPLKTASPCERRYSDRHDHNTIRSTVST